MDAEGVGRVGAFDVRRVDETIERLRAADYRFGGGACCEAVLAELRTAHRMFAAGATDSVRTRLCGAVADLHNLAG
ncbi:hypothetical protein [Lentzea sp. NEAU-D7]|uniref:hypothetical protein n=1 Tax=Lentzea sp. NEAU-D7 TaxID=2994667 RepID=UPI00224A6C83|nr:hypothetical protein [Lentzea sp. NEAU-D7]MCX2946858.1 hypothetical protein [Lentzea sp. NEAU-D7]